MVLGPFVKLTGTPSLVTEGAIGTFYRLSGFDSPKHFLILLGLLIILFLAIGTITAVVTLWTSNYFALHVGKILAKRIFHYYLDRSWLFHSAHNSSSLIKQIQVEVDRMTYGFLVPLMDLVAQTVLAIFLVCAFIWASPTAALICTGLLAIIYATFFLLIKPALLRNSERISVSQEERIRVMAESFGGIKDVILLDRRQSFEQQFSTASQTLATAHAQNAVLGQTPSHLIRWLVFSAMVLILLFLLAFSQEGLETALPGLAVMVLAALKLQPAIGSIFSSAAAMKGNQNAVKTLHSELDSIQHDTKSTVRSHNPRNNLQPLTKNIKFENVTFTYPGKEQPALQNLTLCIEHQKVIGLVGYSGSGKSTAVDLMMGLLDPDEGAIIIDGVPLTAQNMRYWQDQIAFVPQSIFLADTSIKRNIAFGLSENDIDNDKITAAVKKAHLDEVIEQLPCGIDTIIGERGIQLSGGQRQRIGVARALYDDKNVLVLDEATSALDGISEKAVMDAIHDFGGKKTIIMVAHRLSTVQQCDLIYLFENGKTVDQGTYHELLLRNATFAAMAQNTL